MPHIGHKDPEMGRRLHSAWRESKYFNFQQKELLKMLDMTQSALSMYFKGERIPTHKRMVQLAKLFDVSVDWIYTGEGPRKLDPSPYQALAEQFMNCKTEHIDLLRWLIGVLEKEHIHADDMKQAIHTFIYRDADEFLKV